MSISRIVALSLGLVAAWGAVACVSTSAGAGGAGGAVGTSASPSSDPLCVPAAMRSVLAQCTSCHDGSSSKLAPLATVADLEATSPFGTSYGERSVLRMKSTSSPMPPAGVLASTQVTAFAQWVTDGYPLACPSSSSAGGSGGSGSTSTATGAGGATSIGP